MAALSRQDSTGSDTSVLSGMSVASSMAAGGDGMGGPDDFATAQSQMLQKAVFGPLLTLYKERWEDSKRFLTGRVLLEHLQLLLVLLQPQFLWTFDTSHWLWQIANYSLVKILTVPAGHASYASVLYAMLAFMAATVGACVWVSHAFIKKGVVPNKWPVKLLRLLMVVFYKVFYVTVLNYMVAPLNCTWLHAADGTTAADFPAYNCTAMPHLVSMAVGGVGCILVVAVGGLMALGEVTPNPVSQNWLATAHSEVEVKAWLLKSAMVLCANMLAGYAEVQTVLVMIAAGWIAYVHVRYQPYLFEWMNHVRTGLYAMTAHVALLMTIHAFDNTKMVQLGLSAAQLLALQRDKSQQITFLMFVLMPAACAAGVAVSWLRLRLWVKPVLRKFSTLAYDGDGINQNLKAVHKFPDEYEVELAARCCRRWLDYEDNMLDPAGARLTDVIIKAGLARFPASAHMVLVYINFLASVQNNQQSCNSQLQAARQLEASWCDRYVFYVREQQQLALLQAHAGQHDGAGVDLVGYLEFQRTFQQVLRGHKAALYAIRGFWKQLLHSEVPFTGVVAAFRRIEATRLAADRAYHTILERYPANIKVMRAYGRFMEDVCSDPWSASRFFTEADKLEEAESGAHESYAAELAGGGVGGADGQAAAVDKNAAVCVINAQGTIQMANKPLLKMFGYSKGELEGKNVSLLMPQPFASRHNGYLRNYITTGKAKILNVTQEAMALHKDRFVFPLHLSVSKASGSGAEAIFMGVLRPLPDEADTVKVWIMPQGGVMLCVDVDFGDWFGIPPGECLGRTFASLAAEPEALNGLMETAASARQEDFDAGLVAAQDVLLTHKFADPLRVDISLRAAGPGGERLFVATIRKCNPHQSEHLMVTDKKGHIIYATRKLASLLGVGSTKALLRCDFSRFMAQPFMQLHERWMKDMPSKVPLCSCRNGAPVVLITQHRTAVPAKLEILPRDQGGEQTYAVKIMPTVFSTALMDRRLSLAVNAHGDITGVSATPPLVFGFSPALLVGRNLAHCLDVFTGLPATGAPQRLDMEHVLAELVHRMLERKDSSWRCGLHPPLTPDEVAAAKANVLQASMLEHQTKAALLQLEVVQAGDDGDGVASITAHLWRAEMLTGVVEVDREALISKAGCCPLHQPGPLFGVPSSALLRTSLSHWLSVPSSYDGLLLDARKKKKAGAPGGVSGALKRRAADVKIGPLLHASGQHNDGDPVHVTVQAAVKEDTGASGRLVVKLSIERPLKGNPNFARRLLGLPDAAPAATAPGAAARSATLQRSRHAAADQGRRSSESGSSDDGGGGGGGTHHGDDAAAGPAGAGRGGVRFGAQQGEGDAGGAGAGGDVGSEQGEAPQPGKGGGKHDQLMQWAQEASEYAGDDGGHEGLAAEESQATTAFLGLPMPPGGGGGGADDAPSYGYAAPPEGMGMGGSEGGSQVSGADDDASSQQAGSEGGGYVSDFKRGRRLRKLTRMLHSKVAQKNTTRFHTHTAAVVGLLLAAHLACFVVSVVTLDAQKQYIQEVDDAGLACIAMHRMAIDCRVLDALYRGTERPGIFTASEFDAYVALTDDAIAQFEAAHEDTYLGRNNLMRRFINRQKYKLKDYWEVPMWPAQRLLNTTPPRVATANMSLWELGNTAIMSAREVLYNHKLMAEGGRRLSDNPFWFFVMENAPGRLYDGYKITLYGLVERTMAKMGEVRNTMAILLAVEGCGLFLAATVYVCLLVRRMVAQRADLFSVFLVIPAGFLRALASKQVVVVDEDAGSDGDSEMGDLGGDLPPAGGGGGQQQEEWQEGGAHKLSLSAAKKGGKGGGGRASRNGGGKATAGGGLLGRLAGALNPASWFGAADGGGLDTGKRQLVRNSRDVLLLGMPFLLWGVTVIIIYASSMTQIAQMRVPFQMLNIINILVFRTTRTVLFALEACMAAPDVTAVAARQALVAARLEQLRADYLSFLYGFRAVGGGAARNDLSTDQAAVFEDVNLANIFFRARDCQRSNKALCFAADHPFYDATHNGLDAMVVRLMQEVQQLVVDDPADVNITSRRLEYIWQVGRKDMFEGMSRADEIFRGRVEGMFDSLRTSHVAVFVVSVGLALFLWLGLVRPMLARARKESRQMAEMLSQLPAEMDVEALVGQALAAAGDEDAAAPAAGRRMPAAGAGSGKQGGASGTPGRAAPGRAQAAAAAGSEADGVSDAGTDM